MSVYTDQKIWSIEMETLSIITTRYVFEKETRVICVYYSRASTDARSS